MAVSTRSRYGTLRQKVVAVSDSFPTPESESWQRLPDAEVQIGLELKKLVMIDELSVRETVTPFTHLYPAFTLVPTRGTFAETLAPNECR